VIAAAPSAVVLLVVGVVVGVLAGPIAGVVAGVVAGVLWWLGTLRLASRVLVGRLGATMAEVEGIGRAETIVEGLCATMGLPTPDVRVVEDRSRNAVALGRRPDDAVLVVTTGLLASLPPVSLEGVLAHELSHVKSGDVAAATVAAAVLLPFARLTPGAGDIAHRWAGRGREFRADADAVRVTRYPPGLRDALAAMSAGPGPDPVSRLAGTTAVARATRWLWTVALPHGDAQEDVTGVLDASAVRIAALDEW